MILFINACVRENSRTKRIADYFLSKKNSEFTEVRLSECNFPVADENFINERSRLVHENNFDDSMFDLARQFAGADEIVIAAPFWDLSFPAALKQYFEQINVSGITFKYTAAGFPVGLCRAEKLYYITTAGGNFFPEEYGYGYVKALAQNFYGIKDVELIKAKGLDIEGADEEKILHSCMENIVI